MFDASKLQIESVTLEHFKAFMDYNIEFEEYAATTFVECINDMIKLITERGG